MINEKRDVIENTAIYKQIADFWSAQLNNEIFLRNHPDVIRGSKEYFEIILNARRKYIYYLPRMVEFLETAPVKTLLEVGCGMGTDTLLFESKGFQVTGIDLAPAHLQLANRLFDHYGAQGSFIEANVERLPFPDEAFGGVYSFGVLHHTPHTALAIGEIHRVLKPAGRAVVMLYNRNSLNNFVHWITRRGFENAVKRDRANSDAPVTYRFTRKKVSNMCSVFAQCEICTEYLYGAGWSRIYDLVPKPVFERLSKIWGWHLVAYLEK
jgi:ubiquinone/menaquinone biosynthesis C-methylase UbiE